MFVDLLKPGINGPKFLLRDYTSPNDFYATSNRIIISVIRVLTCSEPSAIVPYISELWKVKDTIYVYI